ncbi:MAG: hypothetical protein LBR55_03500 [Bacteroidales bacterium]|jgi:CRISPR-associated endonuclease Csn1|nr:hypothetical protein [Bacteroidales bacterium]
MKKLGLDIGSSSLGWLVNEDGKITKKGVITFNTGMSKGQSGGYVSPTRERREARSKRNLIRARKYRKWELLKILLNEFCPLDREEFERWGKYKKGQICKFPENKQFLQWLACDFTYLENGKKYKNPYELRVKALDDKLGKHEFGRALYHLVQRRGYKDIGETDTETKKQIERRDGSGFQKALNENRTIAEALVNEFLNKDERARNQYPYRAEYEDEFLEICKAQGYDIAKNTDKSKQSCNKKRPRKYKDDLVDALYGAIIWQRDLRTQKGNIGKCTLEQKKLRCPISHPVFEIFRAWSFINTIKYYDENNEKQPLKPELRKQLFEWFLKKDKNFKFEEIRRFLDGKFGKFQKYNYPLDKKAKNDSEKYTDGVYDTSVAGMPVCKGLISVFDEQASHALNKIELFNIGNAPKIATQYSIYDLWHILFAFDERTAKDKKFLEKFATEKLKIENKKDKKGNEYNPFAKLKANFLQGYADLSLKAMCKIIPFLKNGYLYNEAVVLAKMPELLGKNWKEEKEKIFNAVIDANKLYEWNKTINKIANNLIDKYKGDPYFAVQEYQYTLKDSDIQDVVNACVGKFGETSWQKRKDREEIITAVQEKYQEFFKDKKRVYRELQTLTEIFDKKLKEQKINIDSKQLYHHSNLENKYLKKYKIDKKTEKHILPKAKDKFNVDVEILPQAIIDSIKNPMFNKSMSILRKLINELIKNSEIDKETEIVVELARELNDNNKRIAIERYQNERKNNRTKYREFLEEFNKKEQRNLNIEENIPTFELWTEQTFEESIDENENKVVNQNRHEILREKDAIKRYELWTEQKGQCLYTSKMISLSQLFSNQIDIEHTIPRSILPDNTMANQTICYAWYNRDKKKNQLPTQCANFYKDAEGWGTRIEPRLDNWRKTRDHYKKQYEDRLKAKGNEDENTKNKRIQDKHYFKLHYDYWNDKLERFEATEVKDSWVRRQLTDTQMVSKYAREFLKTYFQKVSVQKGIVTSDFRKIFGFQDEDEIKSRNKHTHHAIDALVLTLIPSNSSHRERILKKYYKAIEENRKDKIKALRENELMQFVDVQKFITEIENSTLIFNYEKDKILKQTRKIERKRGEKQYLKDKQGKYVLDKNKNKILLKAQGDTVRSGLFAQTYLGKIRDVERDNFEKEIDVKKLGVKIKVKGLPVKRRNNDWIYKKDKEGNAEFVYVVRKPISDVLSKIDDIIDPVIKELVRKQKDNAIIKDFQGNIIRHVRIKVKAGKEVKERVNYRSQHEYKNKFYAEAGSIPYAIFLQKPNKDGVERKMIPIASFEIAKMYKKVNSFDIEKFITDYDKENKTNFSTWNKQLLKVGQKVFVLKEDNEFENRKNTDFQRNRMYIIKKFSDGSIWLKYHLEATADDDIDMAVKFKKDEILKKIETQYDLPDIKEDETILNVQNKRKDFENKKYKFSSLSDFRLSRLVEKIGKEETKKIKKQLDVYKKQSSSIEVEGETPLLKMSENNCNFLFESVDFEMHLDGTIIFK